MTTSPCCKSGRLWRRFRICPEDIGIFSTQGRWDAVFTICEPQQAWSMVCEVDLSSKFNRKSAIAASLSSLSLSPYLQVLLVPLEHGSSLETCQHPLQTLRFQLSLSLAMSCLCLLDSNKINIFDDRFVWFNRSWSTSLYTTPRRSWICGLSTTDPYFSGSDWLCGAPRPSKRLFHKLTSVSGCLFHFTNRSFWVFNYNTCSR